MNRLLLLWCATGEVAFCGEAEDPVDALHQFYTANNYPPVLKTETGDVVYDKDNIEHLRLDLDLNWSVFNV